MITFYTECGKQLQFLKGEQVHALFPPEENADALDENADELDDFDCHHFKWTSVQRIHTGAWLDITDLNVIEPTIPDSRELVRVVRIDKFECVSAGPK